MKILVTGALGHIGSKFIRSIQPGDYEEVILLDDLSTQRYCSLFNLPPAVPFRFVKEDVCKGDLITLFKGIDVVIHFAAITNAADSFDIQDQVEAVNFAGTERVARACALNGCKLLFPSTTSVYGTQEDVVDEECSVAELKPQSPYADSKLKAEQLLQVMGEKDGLQFFIGRFGTIFGTSIGMRFHTAINKFCWQACTGQPITVWRTALHQRRPYLGLGDAIRSIDFIIKKKHFDSRIYNVLTENLSVNEVIESIRTLVPDLAVEFVDSKIMNQLSYTVSRERFLSLGFEFQDTLAEGITDTITLLEGLRTSPQAGKI